jgi:hypothetical protein
MKNISLKNALSSLVAIALIALVIVPAFATTLADSFYYGTKKECIAVNTVLGQNIYTFQKSCWAGTKDYSGYHYVRAYIGGTNSSATGAVADTGRRYSNGDIKKTCYDTTVFAEGVVVYFPTGYAKYGT